MAVRYIFKKNKKKFKKVIDISSKFSRYNYLTHYLTKIGYFLIGKCSVKRAIPMTIFEKKKKKKKKNIRYIKKKNNKKRSVLRRFMKYWWFYLKKRRKITGRLHSTHF
jgi:hypothetical protein